MTGEQDSSVSSSGDSRPILLTRPVSHRRSLGSTPKRSYKTLTRDRWDTGRPQALLYVSYPLQETGEEVQRCEVALYDWVGLALRLEQNSNTSVGLGLPWGGEGGGAMSR